MMAFKLKIQYFHLGNKSEGGWAARVVLLQKVKAKDKTAPKQSGNHKSITVLHSSNIINHG